MASTSESNSIIKSDRIGRTRYSAQYKTEVLAAYQRSGMSGPAFAKQCGIKYPTFAAWVAKGRQRDEPGVGKIADQRFLLAEFAGSTSDTGLKVELPGGAVVHVSTPAQVQLLGELLKALA